MRKNNPIWSYGQSGIIYHHSKSSDIGMEYLPIGWYPEISDIPVFMHHYTKNIGA